MGDPSSDRWMTSSEIGNMPAMKLSQMDGSFFLASEDDAIGVEHLLAEPKCNDFGGGFLGFDASSTHNCFDIEEFSAFENAYIKNESDMLDCKLILGEKTKGFCDEMVGETDEPVLGGSSRIPDTCEDYLLDTGFADGVWDPNHIPSEGSYEGILALESQSAVSGGRDCGAEMSELSTASNPVLEENRDQIFSFVDKMTINDLHGTFRKIFGHETYNTDKQWLKRRISFGLQNLVEINGDMSLLECHVNSHASEDNVILKASPSTSTFNFNRRPRVRNVKRGRHGSCDFSKTLSSEISNAVFGSPDLGGKQDMFVTEKRLRKPTRRYIEESGEQKSRYHKRKCGISDTSSEDKILQRRSHKKSRNGFGSDPLISLEESFIGACIQVPFGLPVQKGHSKNNKSDSDDIRDSKLLDSKVDSMKEFLLADHDEISEDECITRSKIQKSKSRRKRHIFWSLPEVLKLVEGVSNYGVGRWIEIKRQQFPTSANRTAVDLKDKWRNLLGACFSRSLGKGKGKGKRQVQSRQKHAPQSIPLSILRRVRDLSVIHPYPRERKESALANSS